MEYAVDQAPRLRSRGLRRIVRPKITAHSLNFSDKELNNAALTDLFAAAGRTAPSIIIFEDLDRLYGHGRNRDNLTKITLQHLLNCLDGLNSKDGVIVVATANEPTALDPAILRRPGRFDRVIACRPPTAKLRLEYLCHLGAPAENHETLVRLAAEMDGFSYAQVRETFILAGQLAFNADGAEIASPHLKDALALVRGEAWAPLPHEPSATVAFEGNGRG